MSKLKIAIIGCGGMAGGHARRLHDSPDVDLVGLCDVSEQVVESFIDRHLAECESRPATFTQSAQLYDQLDPDAVFIVTPHTMHFGHCMEGLDRGCHVFVEKPMVTSAADAHALKARVEQTGKILVIGYNTPCTPEFVYLRRQIRDEAFGRLELISGYVVQNWKTPTTGSWRQDPSLSGGGQAYDTGAHLLNSVCWSVESNVAQVHTFLDNHGTPVDVNSSINIRFENGVFAAVTIGGNCPANSGYLMYAFERGKIAVDGWSGGWIEVHDDHGRVKYPPIEGRPQSPAENFIDAILGRAEPRTHVVNGVVQSELMDAIYESASTGAPAGPSRTSTG